MYITNKEQRLVPNPGIHPNSEDTVTLLDQLVLAIISAHPEFAHNPPMAYDCAEEFLVERKRRQV